MKCGLLGEKLGHSYSPQIHAQLAPYTYTLFEKQPDELADFLLHSDFSGLNVTIPYKKRVIPYCTALTETAQKLGAVNTLVRRPDGSLLGHNSDYFGFLSMLQRSGLDVNGKKALVLGSGGASATVDAVLKVSGAQTVIISRSGSNNYSNLERHRDAAVIVNATPVGMYPNVGISPVDLDMFPNLEGVLDLIYNPARTKLLMDAQAKGITAINGLWMLVAQAKESAQYFTGKPISDRVITPIHEKMRRQMENIVLIGMPGCGKSTIGKLLAKKLARQFVDADEKIAELAGMTIPEIFKTHGENGFRELEKQVLVQLGMQSGLIIATGGGCVTKDENYHALHQNGRIYWLHRRLEDLPTDGRPLSQTNTLSDLYAVRMPLYQKFCDAVVDNNTAPEAAVQAILSLEDTI